MDWGAWQAIVHGIAKSWAWLSDFHFHKQRMQYMKNIQEEKQIRKKSSEEAIFTNISIF